MVRVLVSVVALLVASVGTVWGMPSAARVGTALPIVPVANGCGLGFFRTIAGNCVPNRRMMVAPGRAVILPPPCPPGFRRDPNPGRPICYPVY